MEETTSELCIHVNEVVIVTHKLITNPTDIFYILKTADQNIPLCLQEL